MNGSRQPEQVIRPLKRLELENIEPGQLHFGNEKERTDLLIYLPPITAPKTIAESALAINLKSSRTLGQGSFRTQRDETLVVIH